MTKVSIKQEREIEVPSAYTKTNYYPWQDLVWQKLYSSHIKNNQFPHALLLNGAAGTGKRDLAFYLAKGLLCQSPAMMESSNSGIGQAESSPQYEPCHHCRACRLFSAGNHPDIFHLTRPEDKKIIPVDSVRELVQWSVLNSQLGGKKVIIIEPAEAMNKNAANSLLKTLEEPVADTIIILLSDKKQALLATIRSRCQNIDLALPNKSIALNWLKQVSSLDNSVYDQAQARLMLSLGNGAPLTALNLLSSKKIEIRQFIIENLLLIHNNALDPVQAADELNKYMKKKSKSGKKMQNLSVTAYDVIYWMDSIIIDIVRLSQLQDQNQSKNIMNNIDYFQTLYDLSRVLKVKKLLQLSALINKAYIEIQGSVNINLLFEQLFIDWKNCRI
ncbi:MAG: DNA polymerase III subunit delta' [gamma proteobacterium symbiont of Taylorina sp.]|nr:DNA polymerase III subunit delta' [gamma proteobacterium symbiont of Taylorina sp.]